MKRRTFDVVVLNPEGEVMKKKGKKGWLRNPGSALMAIGKGLVTGAMAAATTTVGGVLANHATTDARKNAGILAGGGAVLGAGAHFLNMPNFGNGLIAASMGVGALQVADYYGAENYAGNLLNPCETAGQQRCGDACRPECPANSTRNWRDCTCRDASGNVVGGSTTTQRTTCASGQEYNAASTQGTQTCAAVPSGQTACSIDQRRNAAGTCESLPAASAGRPGLPSPVVRRPMVAAAGRPMVRETVRR